MKRGSTLFLKIAVILIGIPVLALCIFLLPQIANEANDAAQIGSRFGLYGISPFNRYVCISDTILLCFVSGF